MGRRATAKEVAQAAGVSKWTVMRAFTPGASITEETRAKVLKVAQKLNYSPNLLARSLATNLTNQVAVFVDDFGNPHKLPFLEKLTERLQAEGLIVMLININRYFDHVHALLNADQRQVDAIVLFGTSFRDETLRDKRLRQGLPPLIVLARDSQIKDVPAVTCDASIAMDEICAYLGTKPYRRPGFMPGPQTLSTALRRRCLFKQYWNQRGIVDIPELPAERYSVEAGAEAMRTYLAASPADQRIDLLMCENDVLATGAMDVIRSEFGLRVPTDIAVSGFDNAGYAATPAYDLTTYEQPIDEMVQATVEMILGRREKKTLQLRGRLVPRSSA
jgi:LacI family transcriptional regulator